MPSPRLKILALPKYGPAGASSRHRFYQFAPLLEQFGLDVTVSPLLPDEYVQELYARRAIQPALIAAAMAQRVRQLFHVKTYDLVWLEGELFPWVPDLAEYILARGRIPYVADYDDAIFHRYDSHRSTVVRGLLGNKIDRVMRRAAAVVAGSSYLADRARVVGAQRVVQLPTVVDVERYGRAERKPSADKFTMVWIGSPSTQSYLTTIQPALEALTREGARLKAIGVSADFSLNGVTFERIAWSE